MNCEEWRERSSGSPDAGFPPEPGFRPLPSLAFWFCLGVSAAIFATVFLAPRLRTYRDLRRDYDGLERELIASEAHVDYLQKVADALGHDANFAAELARVDFGISGTEERIPVAPPLNLNGERTVDITRAPDGPRPFPTSLLETPLVDALADDRSVRGSLLGAASLVVLVAFTFLCDTGPRVRDENPVRWRRRCRAWFAERYAQARR